MKKSEETEKPFNKNKLPVFVTIFVVYKPNVSQMINKHILQKNKFWAEKVF